jgi:hypothetical protein
MQSTHILPPRKARIYALLSELVELLVTDDEPELYSTERPELYPPRRRTRRAARDAIRQVPGHYQIGTGRETQWRVSRSDYERHHARRPSVATPLAPIDVDALAERALAEARLRRTR